AFVRFPGNNTPFSADAYYWGELNSVPVDSTEFVGPFSPNFPAGGALTPGGTNDGGPAAPTKATVDGDGDGRTDYAVARSNAGQLTWWTSLAGTNETTASEFGQTGDELIAEDWDGDGKDDVSVYRDGVFYILQSSNATVRTVPFGL